MNGARLPMLTGDAVLTSPWFSSRWTLEQQGGRLATLQRLGRIYVSSADLGPHGRMLIEPCGRSTVHCIDAAAGEVARITRQSWIGRRWEIEGFGFAYDLVSDPRPRRWHMAVANAPLATLEGSLVSYNHVKVHANLAVPIPALLLAWHVIARPWEAAAEPRGLIPAKAEPASA